MSTAATRSPRVFEGKSTDVEGPFLAADFWREGTRITGTVVQVKNTVMDQPGQLPKPSIVYLLDLDDPVEMEGEDVYRVCLGNLAGLRMALQAMKLERLAVNDKIELECDSIKPAKKEGFSPRVNFRMKVNRP